MKSHHVHRGIHAVHVGLTSGLLMVTVLTVAFYSLVPALFVSAGIGTSPFSATSVWNVSLPRYPKINTNTEAMVRDIMTQVAGYGAVVDINDKGAPIYIAEPTTPMTSVTPWGCDGPADTSLATQWAAVPVPFYAQPSGGASGRMIIRQPSTDTIWEFSHMYKSGGQWFACHGGMIANSSMSSGIFSGTAGVNTSGLALMGGSVTIADMQSGLANHTIGLVLPSLSSGVSWPAVRSSGGAGSVATGTRLQLDPSLNVDSLGLSAYGRMVARTAQVYGFVVWDTGPQVAIAAENALSYTTRGAPNPYGSTSLAGFPWSSLRALPSDYGLTNHFPTLSSFTTSASKVANRQSVSLSWQASNISECAIPGVASHLGQTGTVQTPPLESSASFSIFCSGPNGSVTDTLNVSVGANDPALPPPPPQAVNLAQPVGGFVNVVSELFDPAILESIYKVAFYERSDLLQVTTKAPFDIDTKTIADGKHEVAAKIFFRDGSDQTRRLSVQIMNNPASLIPARPLATAANTRSTVPMMLGGLILSLSTMILTGWWGWHRQKPTVY